MRNMPRLKGRCPWPIGLSALLFPAIAFAQLPVWEAGLGAGSLSIPSYRGSDERSTYLLPLPYLVYRGDRLRIDRDGMRGDLFRSERLRLDLSVGAGPPSKNDDPARVGMSDIDPTIEAGPALEIKLGSTDTRKGWSVVLPLRAVIATDFRHTQSLGWVFAPYLRYDAPGLPAGWLFDMSLGPMYAGERYHEYYYEVAPAFATPARPAYDARGGYSGSRITLALSKRFKDFWVGAFARYDNLSGAAMDDSPLVQTEHSFMIGAGIIWILARSAQTAAGSD